ncbi:glutamate and aspartate transporter subunit [Klebsiella pneumoniae]|uniref:Glutamate and aspartate transporter subunit n=1 Tax=Klebsiella pneumoniae TaxID=573 RepID=A0A2X3E7P5_KLEPN|nr:glutamate and aspartate transporter subunit [Klebsiella pneumoniae]
MAPLISSAAQPPNNLERQKQAAFSDTIFVVGTRLLVKKGGPIKDFPDLKDKAVVVTSGPPQRSCCIS